MAAIFVVVVIGMVIVGVLAYRARQRRIEALARLALQLGFAYSAHDDANLLALPFALFARGDGRTIRDVVSGTRDGTPVQLFELEYYDEHTSSGANGIRNTSRSYTRLTCGLLTLPMAVPHLTIGPENVLTRLGARLGLHDVELESNEFNRAYRVHCDDQRFAFSWLDAAMMEWLLSFTTTVESLEVCGPWVLLGVERLAPEEWPMILDFFRQLHAHVPDVVFTTYPPR